MSRPEPTTGTATVTAYYNDGATVLPSGTAQIVNTSSGEEVGKVDLENGTATFEETAGEYVINIIVNGDVVGSITVVINVGDVQGQAVTTNKRLD